MERGRLSGWREATVREEGHEEKDGGKDGLRERNYM